jgi:hypothetical protein
MQKNTISIDRRERDTAFEHWLASEVAASYDAMRTDPSRGLSVDSAFASVRDRHAERVRVADRPTAVDQPTKPDTPPQTSSPPPRSRC